MSCKPNKNIVAIKLPDTTRLKKSYISLLRGVYRRGCFYEDSATTNSPINLFSYSEVQLLMYEAGLIKTRHGNISSILKELEKERYVKYAYLTVTGSVWIVRMIATDGYPLTWEEIRDFCEYSSKKE